MGEVKTPIFLNVNNEEINNVVIIQVLVVLIDAKLTWKTHISEVRTDC